MHCVEKEQDTFPTIYAKDYVWHKNSPGFKKLATFDAFALTKEEKKNFIDPNAVKEIPWDEQLAIIQNLYAQRMKTVYYKSYCEHDRNKSLDAGEEETNPDSLFEVADKVYTKKSQKVLAPPPTSRRVLGYCRPSYFYTGLSEYQGEFGRLGYEKLIPSRDSRLNPRLPFCDQFK